MRLRSTLLTLLLIVFAAACAEEPEYGEGTYEEETTTDTPLGATETMNAHLFGDADADASGWLDEDEFGAGFAESGYYDRWDADASGGLTEDEYGTGLFNQYDANRDGILDENEYGLFEGNYLTGYPGYTNERTFGDYDADATGDLTEDEFRTGFAESGYYDRWDADASGDLTEDEFRTGLFGVYDNDANQQLDETEYNSYDRDWATLE